MEHLRSLLQALDAAKGMLYLVRPWERCRSLLSLHPGSGFGG